MTVSGVIMAHPDREAFIPALRQNLDRPTPIVWDRISDRWDTGRRALLSFDSKATHSLVIQDDGVVCRDLYAGVEAALAHVPPGVVLSLYAGRTRVFRTAVAQATRLSRRARRSPAFLASTQLLWGVAVVIPTGYIPDLVEWGDGRPEIANYDKRISYWCQANDVPVWYTWPSLVQHRVSPSLVPGRGSAGRIAYKFHGDRASALTVDWAAGHVDLPEVPVRRPAAGRRRR